MQCNSIHFLNVAESQKVHASLFGFKHTIKTLWQLLLQQKKVKSHNPQRKLTNAKSQVENIYV